MTQHNNKYIIIYSLPQLKYRQDKAQTCTFNQGKTHNEWISYKNKTFK